MAGKLTFPFGPQDLQEGLCIKSPVEEAVCLCLSSLVLCLGGLEGLKAELKGRGQFVCFPSLAVEHTHGCRGGATQEQPALSLGQYPCRD